MAFAHNGDKEGDTMVTHGSDTCTRCGRNNHAIDKCRAKYHHDGTILFMEEATNNNPHDDKDVNNGFDGLIFNMTDVEDDMRKNTVHPQD